jgi:ABC-type arginine transport system permease subunit
MASQETRRQKQRRLAIVLIGSSLGALLLILVLLASGAFDSAETKRMKRAVAEWEKANQEYDRGMAGVLGISVEEARDRRQELERKRVAKEKGQMEAAKALGMTEDEYHQWKREFGK